MAIDSVRDCRLEIPPVPARCHAGSARPPNFSLVPRFAFSQCRCPLPIVFVRGGQPRPRRAMALARGRRRNSASQDDFSPTRWRHFATHLRKNADSLLQSKDFRCFCMNGTHPAPCTFVRCGAAPASTDESLPETEASASTGARPTGAGRHPPGEAGSDGLARPRGRPGRAEQEQQLNPDATASSTVAAGHVGDPDRPSAAARTRARRSLAKPTYNFNGSIL